MNFKSSRAPESCKLKQIFAHWINWILNGLKWQEVSNLKSSVLSNPSRSESTLKSTTTIMMWLSIVFHIYLIFDTFNNEPFVLFKLIETPGKVKVMVDVIWKCCDVMPTLPTVDNIVIGQLAIANCQLSTLDNIFNWVHLTSFLTVFVDSICWQYFHCELSTWFNSLFYIHQVVGSWVRCWTDNKR